MLPTWSPELWGEFTGPGVAIFMCAMLIASLLRGWVVLGKFHKEMIAVKDDEIAELRKRAMHDATAIDTLSRSMVEKNAAEDATTKILAAFRAAVAGQGGDT